MAQHEIPKLLTDVKNVKTQIECYRLSNRLLEEILYYLSRKHVDLNSNNMFDEELNDWCNLIESVDDLRSKYDNPHIISILNRQYEKKSLPNILDDESLIKLFLKYNKYETYYNEIKATYSIHTYE